MEVFQIIRPCICPSEEARECYREEDELQEIVGMHNGFIESLRETKTLVLFGLSLSPLDSELAQIISCGIKEESINTVYVVNPNYEKVCHRVKILLRNPNILVQGINPSDWN